MEYIEIEETPSTNSWMQTHAASLREMTIVRANSQTAGRGQRGNRWEAAPGLNLTMSALLRPLWLHPARQFAVSEAVALAVADTLLAYGIAATVKWPNDIYVADRKICGILIENAIDANSILQSVCGVGLNVNQPRFHSDAPNPVSMHQLTGLEYSLDEVCREFGRQLEQRTGMTATPGGRDLLHEEYLRRLYRGDGRPHPFRDTASGDEFQAMIAGVDPDGPLLLLTGDFRTLRYNFKEVSFLP